MVSSRKADACEKVADDINTERGAEVAAPIPCNINYKEQLQMLVAKTRETWGKIDVLVCNAALNPYYGPQPGHSRRSLRQDHGRQHPLQPLAVPRW